MNLDGGHCASQKKEWIDDDMMNKWIDLVLVLWMNSKAPSIVPVLILGAYHAHMMGKTVNRIQFLGIQGIHPVHVGINKKSRLA